MTDDLEGVSSTFRDDSQVMVAAIDFGTTYSGYGFSFNTSPKDVISNRNWGDELGATSHKAPTSVLVDDQDQFVAFGYSAEHKYSQLCLTDEGQGYNLYRHFKMMLYHKRDLSRKTEIKSTTGNTCKAMQIFAMALRYLKDHLLEAVSKQVDGQPDESLIKWVITIPAIWNDKAKQFMREAAFEGGLIDTKESKQLLLALEPEAASVMCRNLDVCQFTDTNLAVDVKFEPGTKYVIIDAGGGTIDIAGHEVLPGGHMREIACGSGGDWGGSQVDKNFISLVTSILGEDFMESFKKKSPSEWLTFLIQFESKKKAANLGSSSGMLVQLSYSMGQTYTEVTGLKIEDAIEKNSHRVVSFKQGNIFLSKEVVNGLFNPIIENIISHIRHELNENQQLAHVHYFLLVGGFSDSKILHERLQSAFSSTAPVLIPHSAGLAIIKGAVMFGHNPKTVVERIARKTYGKSVCAPFDRDKHDSNKLFIDQDTKTDYCSDVFKLLIQKGEILRVDDVKTFCTAPFSQTSTGASTRIFTSDRVNIVHTDEPEVEEIGYLDIKIPLSSAERKIETKVFFGLTEIEVDISDVSSRHGDTAKCSIDFLTDKIQYKQDEQL